MNSRTTISGLGITTWILLAACGGGVAADAQRAEGGPVGNGGASGSVASAAAASSGAFAGGSSEVNAAAGGGVSSGSAGDAGRAGAATSSTGGSGVVVASAGAGGSHDVGGSSSLGGAAPSPNAWDGKSFVVHEWGTNTVVVGSDGAMQAGLHHEEEDLPSFVYDRIKAGGLAQSVAVKMETPVTYFYSPTPRTVSASVSFPRGVFTQWFPAALSFAPQVADGAEFGKPGTILDPALDVHFPFGSATCAAQYGAIQSGSLDWGNVEVLARDASSSPPDAPLDSFTWSYARQTQSNVVRVTAPKSMGTEDEKFLFYRGLGNFQLPVRVTSQAGGVVELDASSPIGAAFVLRVDGAHGAFHSFPQGVSKSLTDLAPSLDDASPSLDDFVEQLGTAVTSALDATGLFHDEAVAMVSTWKRQWFRTPGLRVLYLVPPSFTDAQIPLSISPAPDTMLRTMMIRVELLTPELESEDLAEVLELGGADDASAESYFTALGRFAEPRLRRALSLTTPTPAALSFLDQIRSASTTSAWGE